MSTPQSTPPQPQTAGDASSADLFDYQLIRQYAGFALRSTRRHRVLWLTVLAFFVALTIAAVVYMPRTYEVTAKLLAQKNELMASLNNPHRNMPQVTDGPTRAAYETVMARDNLVAMIKETKLIENWEANRNAAYRLKDRITGLVGGPLDEDQKIDNFVHLLEKRLEVVAPEAAGTVEIRVTWPNAQMARQLADTATQNFLEARHVSEVSAISESISILEMHATEMQQEVEAAVTEAQRVTDERRRGRAVTPRPLSVRPKITTSSETNSPQELAQIKFLIRAKRHAYADLEEFRNRRLVELQSQLAEQRQIYSANHPLIIDIEQRILGIQKESPQVAALKRDEEALIAQYRSMGGKDPNSLVEPNPAAAASSVSSSSISAALSPLSEDLEVDPVIAVSRDHLRMAVARFQDLQMRIDAAKIELDTARAAFKYRYTVVNPPQLPRRPIKPNIPVIFLGGLLASFVFALLATALVDLTRRKVIESWQVERALGIPVLGEVRG